MTADQPDTQFPIEFDVATRASNSVDQGNIIQHVPSAVVRPRSVSDVQKIVQFCRCHRIKVAMRGQHHSTFGQGLTSDVIIESRSLNAIHSIGPDSADVDAGVTWKDLVQASLKQGLRPPGLTGYTALSIGGTLSVGGCSLSNRSGALVDGVKQLTIVTGTGNVEECSDHENRELFEAALGGLGQCGFITRAVIDLVPAPSSARTHQLRYVDKATFLRDFRTLYDRAEMDEVYGVIGTPPGASGLVYEINATVFFDPKATPVDRHLLRDLQFAPPLAIATDRSYLDYALLVDQQIDQLRAMFAWDALIKPWFDVWLPEPALDDYVISSLDGLAPEDVGPFGFILLFAKQQSKMKRPFLRLPEATETDRVWLFDILTASAAPGPNPEFIRQMLARNRTLYEKARAVGGIRYPIGAQHFTQDDWKTHFGARWHEFAQRKQAFDPDRILTPGVGIF